MLFFKKNVERTSTTNNQDDKKEIGNLLKRARENFSISLEEMAKDTNVNSKILEKLENGTFKSGLILNDIEKIVKHYPLSYNQKDFIVGKIDKILSENGNNILSNSVNLKNLVDDIEKEIEMNK